MKVRDLLAELQYSDPDAEVMVGYDYGDYWHSTVFQRPVETSETKVVFSRRYDKYELLDEQEDEQEIDKSKVLDVFVLSAEYLEGDM